MIIPGDYQGTLHAHDTKDLSGNYRMALTMHDDKSMITLYLNPSMMMGLAEVLHNKLAARPDVVANLAKELALKMRGDDA